MARSATARQVASPEELHPGIETLGPEVGKRIRAARQSRGLSLAQLGGSDLSRSFLSLVELGRSRISLKALSIVAGRLDLPMSYFLEGDIAPRAAAAELLLDEAQVAIERGNPDNALQLLDGMDAPESAQARLGLIRATAHLAADRPRDAIREAEATVPVAQRQGDTHRESNLQYIIGAALYWMSAYEEAQVFLRQVVERLTRENGDPALLAKATVCLGHILFAQGEVDTAIDQYARARELFGALTNLDAMASVYSGLSLAYERKNDYSTALHYSKLSLSMYERRQNLIGAARSLNNMAVRYLELNDLELAMHTAEEAVSRSRAAGFRDNEALANSTLARIYLRMDRFDDAQFSADAAVLLAEDDRSMARIDGWTVLAGLAERDGEHDTVDALYQKALAGLGETENRLRYADIAVEYSLALRRRGEMDRAFDLALTAAQAKSARSA